MAVIVVQVGQCGNQLGDELLSQLSVITQNGDTPSIFFTRDHKARFVLVDSEPKVVEGVVARHASLVRRENVVCGQSGRGNNWGLGYYGVHDPNRSQAQPQASTRAFRNMYKDQRISDDHLLTNALRAIHLETRRTSDADLFEAIIVVHSLVGGTGSGFASRLMEKIRLYFVDPRAGEAAIDDRVEARMAMEDGLDGMLVEKRKAKYMISVSVAPLSTGELSTQGMNAALTLHTLHRCADATILLRNDDVMAAGDTCSTPTLLKRCVTFKEANEVLATLLLPVFRYGAAGCVEALVHHCVPLNPRITGGNRFLTLLPTPQRVYERYRHSTQRCCFFALLGAKQYMPGCKPELPLDVIMSGSSAQRSRGDHSSDRQHSLQRGGAVWRGRGRANQCSAPPRWHGATESNGSDEEGNSEYMEVTLQVPPSLIHHFQRVPRSRITALFQSLEGVAVLNQARELNETLLFPLLCSAALKVKIGAFTAVYEAAGVRSDRVEKAYREVAAILCDAEEL